MTFLNEEKMSPEDALVHFGVKGMKWGVRKETPYSSDVHVKRGTEIQNISTGTARDISGHVYGAYTERDKLRYRGMYAQHLGYRTGDPSFSNVFTVKKDLKAAGEIRAKEEFQKLWETDKDTLVKSLAVAQKDIKVAAAFNTRILKLNRDPVYEQRIARKGAGWVERKGFDEFIKTLASPESAQGRKLYFDHMRKLGYDAVIDLNDTKNFYNTDKPLLIFKGTDSLKGAKSVQLSEGDIQRALDEYALQKEAFE